MFHRYFPVHYWLNHVALILVPVFFLNAVAFGADAKEGCCNMLKLEMYRVIAGNAGIRAHALPYPKGDSGTELFQKLFDGDSTKQRQLLNRENKEDKVTYNKGLVNFSYYYNKLNRCASEEKQVL